MSTHDTRGKWKVDALCPFFRGERSKERQVLCEGCTERQKLTIAFSRKKDQEAWLRSRCASWEYAQCPYYKCIAGELEKPAAKEKGRR